jgi:hypothetical protein
MAGAYFLNAGVLYNIAKGAYERTKSAETDTTRGQNDAAVALLFSAATLEAFIMELALHAESGADLCPQPSPLLFLSHVLKETEASRGSIRLKYLLAKSILSGQSYDQGSKPYQDFNLLFNIRDAIVHLKPEQIKPRTHKIVAALSSMKLCSHEDPNVQASWLHQITTRAVAQWACNVVRDMVNSIRDCIPDDAEETVNPYMMMAFGTRHFKGVD